MSPESGDRIPGIASGFGLPTFDVRSHTPKHLIDKIVNGRSTLAGARKQVTVLFAAVRNAAGTPGHIVPQRRRDIADGFFGILAAGIHRFEGVINESTSDGIMAIFGAPIVHEDHAQRACHAVLYLSEELRRYADELRLEDGVNFSARMGMSTGELVIGEIGEDLRMRYVDRGDTVCLAARMEQLAEAGRALLTEHTASLVWRHFDLRDLGPAKIADVAQPVRVVQLLGSAARRAGTARARAPQIGHFVGRTDEMAALENALDEAIGGNGRVVGIAGEAGIGKSRMCHEFVQRCHDRAHEMLHAGSVAEGAPVPFSAILTLFRRFFGVSRRDGDRITREKIAGRLTLLDETFRESLPLIFDFMNVPDPDRSGGRMDPNARRRRLFEVLRRIVHAHSRQQTLVIVIEDLHCIDDASALFVDQLVATVVGVRVLLLLTFRPGYRAAWMEQPHYQQLALVDLGPQSLRALVTDLAGGDASLNGLDDLIERRTGGNPLYAEESIQWLATEKILTGARGCYGLAHPVARIELPETIEEALARRIERLDDDDRTVLQAAAVVGGEFGEAMLRRVLDSPDLESPEVDLASSLCRLADTNLLREDETAQGERLYVFRHALMREAAYRSLPADRRARFHGAAARAVGRIDPQTLDERAALLAHHWERAGDVVEAARWRERAAQWLLYRDPDEAIRHWRRVRDSLGKVPETGEAIDLGLKARLRILRAAWTVGILDGEAVALFDEGRRLAARRGDFRTMALLHWAFGITRLGKGWVTDCLKFSLDAAQLAEKLGDDELVYPLQLFVACARVWTGNLREAQRVAARVLERVASEDRHFGEEVLGASPLVLATSWMGVLLALQGDLTAARPYLERGLRFASELGDARFIVLACYYLTQLAHYSGETCDAMETAEMALEVAESLGNAQQHAAAQFSVGHAHLVRAEWDQAATTLAAAVAYSRDNGVFLEWEPNNLARLAEACLGRGDLEASRSTAEEALQVARKRGMRLGELDAQLVLARALIAAGRPAGVEVERALDAAEALIRETGASTFSPFLHETRAERARIRGDAVTCERKLQDARHSFAQMGASGHAARLARRLA